MNKNLTPLIVRSLVGLLIVLALMFVAGIVVGILSARGTLDADRALVWLVGAVAVIIMTGGMVVSVAWMRSIDEAAQEAHKAAWFWGGCGGMMVGGIFIILTVLPQARTWAVPSWAADRTDPAAYAATGAFSMMLLMLLGYTIVWAWWWWRRR
jgi:hypothetical protein